MTLLQEAPQDIVDTFLPTIFENDAKGILADLLKASGWGGDLCTVHRSRMSSYVPICSVPIHTLNFPVSTLHSAADQELKVMNSIFSRLRAQHANTTIQSAFPCGHS